MIRTTLVTILVIYGCSNSITTPPTLEPSGRRLRVIVEDKYPDKSVIIGGTTGSWAFGANTGLILDREFSYVTPENDFKQSTIHPDPTTWDWTRSDAWIQHIADNSQILRMHSPISRQCSGWAKDDSRTAAELEEQAATYKAILETLLEKRSTGKVAWNIWHIDDGKGWNIHWYPSLFKADYSPKPAYYAIQEALENK